MLDDSPLFSFWRLAPPDLRFQIGIYPENITMFLYFVPDGRSFLVISPKVMKSKIHLLQHMPMRF